MERQKAIVVLLILLPLCFGILFSENTEEETTSFTQRRQQAQERAEEYNDAVYDGEVRASDDEVAAAVKNFNPEVESQYRADNSQLNSSFNLLNEIEKNWNFSSFEKKYSSDWDLWMEEGQVGAFAQ